MSDGAKWEFELRLTRKRGKGKCCFAKVRVEGRIWLQPNGMGWLLISSHSWLWDSTFDNGNKLCKLLKTDLRLQLNAAKALTNDKSHRAEKRAERGVMDLWIKDGLSWTTEAWLKLASNREPFGCTSHCDCQVPAAGSLCPPDRERVNSVQFKRLWLKSAASSHRRRYLMTPFSAGVQCTLVSI